MFVVQCCQPGSTEPHFSSPVSLFCIFTVNIAEIVHLKSVLDHPDHYMQIYRTEWLPHQYGFKQEGSSTLLIPITGCIYTLQLICTFPWNVPMYKELLVQLLWGLCVDCGCWLYHSVVLGNWGQGLKGPGSGVLQRFVESKCKQIQHKAFNREAPTAPSISRLGGWG